MALTLFAIGFFSLLAQVTLLRELSVAFYGNDLIYTLSLGCWLFWSAVGALVGARRAVPSTAQVSSLLLVFGPTLLGVVVFTRASHRIFAGVPGADLPFPLQLVSLTAALFPVGILLGLLFQWAGRSFVSRGKTLGVAYAIESAGAVLGGVTGTLALGWGVQNLTQALFCSLLAVALATALASGSATGHATIPTRSHAADRATGPLAGRSTGHPGSTTSPGTQGLFPRFSRVSRLISGVVLTCFFVGVLPFAGTLDRWLTSWTHEDLVATEDTPYGRITVTSAQGQTSIFSNNALAYETEGTGAEQFVHLALLQHPDPRKILILGGGAEGLVREALKHGPEAIVYVDVDRRFLDLVMPFLPERDRESLVANSVEIVIADPRNFLDVDVDGDVDAHADADAHADPDAHYDVILVGMPEPTSGQTGRYYSREFFRKCASRLRSGGVLALRLRSSENLWTRQLVLRSASIFNALESALADVLILPGATNIVIASEQPRERSPHVLAERFGTRGIDASLMGPEYLEYVYGSDRLPQIAELISEAPRIMNTDSRPVGYQHSQMLWLSQFFPSLANMNPTPMELWTGVSSLPRWTGLGLVALAGLLFVRRREPLRRASLVAVAGFLGMVLENALLLDYQTRQGILYRDIGALLTVFMVGLTLGSLWAAWWMNKSDTAGPFLRPALPLAFAGLAILVARLVQSGETGHPVVAGLCLLVTGALVGGTLAHASLDGVAEQDSVVAPLYAADLFGGSVGSVVATLFLFPVLGLGLALSSLSALGLAALLLSVRRVDSVTAWTGIVR